MNARDKLASPIVLPLAMRRNHRRIQKQRSRMNRTNEESTHAGTRGRREGIDVWKRVADGLFSIIDNPSSMGRARLPRRYPERDKRPLRFRRMIRLSNDLGEGSRNIWVDYV